MPSGKFQGGAAGPPLARRGGFSVTELLVGMTILTAVATLLGASFPSMTAKARNMQCLAKMKNLGGAILLCAQDNEGELPRSLHSAGRAGQQPWAKAISPYLAASSGDSADWPGTFNRQFRCPEDKNRAVTIYSYGLNVFYELTPGGDDYEGAPATWRRLVNIPHPARTILLAEQKASSFADHIMCHLWSRPAAASTAVDALRHGKKTSNFVFADGHVESLPIGATYDPGKRVNRWNPSLAGN